MLYLYWNHELHPLVDFYPASGLDLCALFKWVVEMMETPGLKINHEGSVIEQQSKASDGRRPVATIWAYQIQATEEQLRDFNVSF